jgi:hypothetical protein
LEAFVLKKITAQPLLKNDQVKLISPNDAYFAVTFIALIFVLFTTLAMKRIKQYNPHINFKLYFITHVLIILFELVLWLIITRAVIRFKSYTLIVIKNKDGQALNYIANSLLLSLAYAILFCMASTIKTLFWHSSMFKSVTTITNLVPLFVILVTSIYIFLGTQKLRHLSNSRLRDSNIRPYLSLLFVFVVSYSLYFYQAAPKLLDDDGLRHFALHATTLLFVYVLPYTIVWVLGVFSCVNLYDYATNVRGVIYKALFSDLYKGLIISFIATYLVQLFDISNLSANTFNFGFIVVLALIVLLMRGYFLIYRGTNQLYKLES